MPTTFKRLRLAAIVLITLIVVGRLAVETVDRVGETVTCFYQERHDSYSRHTRDSRHIFGECACLHLLHPACL